MAEKYISAKISPSKRVQIVKSDSLSYWKPGQFGYAVSYTTHPGMRAERGPTEPGELAFLVSKSKDMRGGGSWFSSEALRFTKPPAELGQLTAAERVALDLFLENGNGKSNGRRLRAAELIPDAERRAHVRATAAQLRSLRGR